MAVFHGITSEREVPQFETGPIVGKYPGGISTGVLEFKEHFNNYVDDYNSDMRNQHLLAMGGYFGAAATSLISLCVMWREKRHS